MKGLRRVQEGPPASTHLRELKLSHRAVQVLQKGAAGTSKAVGSAQKTRSTFTQDDDLADAGTQELRKTPGRVKNAAHTVNKSVTLRPGATARSRALAELLRVGGGRLRAGGVASAKKAARVPATVGSTASRGAVAASRAAATAAHAVRAVVAAVTTAISTSPAAMIAAVVVAVVVLVVGVVGWLLPGFQQNSQREATIYGVGVAPGPWGGFSNGFIPEENLTEIPWAPGRYLRSDAVTSLIALNEEFTAKFGYSIGVSDAYRDFAGQVEAKQKYGDGAAEPGQSDHGWALAVDFGTGIASFGTPQYLWMKAHGPEFGWRHPAWAEPNGRLPEPWHWEFWGWAPPGSNTGAGGSAAARDFARGVLGDSLQFQCLDRLWVGESGWNPLAKNPSSGAYGIPQALPAHKLASAGADWATNGVTQVKWGLEYIRGRYGTPCNAWAFWQSNNPHWY